jgi:hypothetical protein
MKFTFFVAVRTAYVRSARISRFASLFSFCAAFTVLGAEVEPPVITPGADYGKAPSDAIVLFDGKDLSKWQSVEGKEAKWVLKEGAMEVNGTGSIRTKEEFGDVQLHVEWAAPTEVKGNSQERGNSGVYLQGRYEIQVLDSYQNKTYSNGQAGSFYGNAAPLVNASRKPGEWQSYDIIFRTPKKGADGTIAPGKFTVFHNGVLVLDEVPVKGGATTAAAYKDLAEKGPVLLQDHGNPVRFRNIWLRKLDSK